eukprot:gene42183-57115_t
MGACGISSASNKSSSDKEDWVPSIWDDSNASLRTYMKRNNGAEGSMLRDIIDVISIEEAVAREIFEEAGVRVGAVRYIASQPWPFPSSLMMACVGSAENDTLTVDHNELEDAIWVERDVVRAVLAGEPGPFLPPPPYAIAYTLLREWIERVEPPKRRQAVSFDFLPAPRSGDDVVSLKSVDKRYGSRTIYEGLDFMVARRERWAGSVALGYTFNPLSAYFCYGADGALALIIYEVRNTFGDIHPYVLPVLPGEQSAAGIRQEQDKLFYVSPFIEMAMRYRFRVSPPAQSVKLRILETDADGPILSATFIGQRRALSSANLLRSFFSLPLVTLKIMAAIHWEALRLWIKGARLVPRPAV